MYLIVTKRTIHHEGDERSRTHPEHGYPAWSEEVESVKSVEDKDEMLRIVTDHLRHKTEFILYDAVKLNAKIDIIVSVETSSTEPIYPR